MKRISAKWLGTLAPGVLLPQYAFACEGLEVEAYKVIAWLLGTAFVFALPAVPVWGAKWLWKMASGSTPSFGVFSMSSGIHAVTLAVMGTYFAPAFRGLYDSFGSALPAQTQMVMDFNYLLLLPAILLPLLVPLLKARPRREWWFAAYLGAESTLVCFTLWALYSPVFRMC